MGIGICAPFVYGNLQMRESIVFEYFLQTIESASQKVL
jgi:hypothetical protein